MHGVEPKGVDCPAIDGILEEADDIAGEVADKVLDAALAAAAQAVEHYEITRYGTLIAWAKQPRAQRLRHRAAEEPGRRRAADKKRRSPRPLSTSRPRAKQTGRHVGTSQGEPGGSAGSPWRERSTGILRHSTCAQHASLRHLGAAEKRDRSSRSD